MTNKRYDSGFPAMRARIKALEREVSMLKEEQDELLTVNIELNLAIDHLQKELDKAAARVTDAVACKDIERPPHEDSPYWRARKLGGLMIGFDR